MSYQLNLQGKVPPLELSCTVDAVNGQLGLRWLHDSVRFEDEVLDDLEFSTNINARFFPLHRGRSQGFTSGLTLPIAPPTGGNMTIDWTDALRAQLSNGQWCLQIELVKDGSARVYPNSYPLKINVTGSLT